jgi:hypothetical protein
MPGSATLDDELVAFGPDGAPDVGLAGTPDLNSFLQTLAEYSGADVVYLGHLATSTCAALR